MCVHPSHQTKQRKSLEAQRRPDRFIDTVASESEQTTDSGEAAVTMSRTPGGGAERRSRYRGVRRRRWGKWVSEIRVPGTRERLWLGSYAAPEAAAVAHDAAACLLRGGAEGQGRLNFPERAASYYAQQGRGPPLSPRSVQRVASDAGMAADAQLIDARGRTSPPAVQAAGAAGAGIVGVAQGGGHGAGEQWPSVPYSGGIGVAQGGSSGGASEQWPIAPYSGGTGTAYWRAPCTGGSTSSSASSEQLVYGDISVEDIEILM
ncbi:hypothetical protein ACP4OV_012867 [Aristida adscensionis]